MKFKERPPSTPGQEPAERDDVRVATNRCPFCHDEVEAPSSVVCEGCLARHHGSCWEELGCCGSCRGEQRLERADPTTANRESPGAWESEASEEQKRRVQGLQRLTLAWQGFYKRHPLITASLETLTLVSILWLNEWAMNWLSVAVLLLIVLTLASLLPSIRNTDS